MVFGGDVLPHPAVVRQAARNGAAVGVGHDFAPMFSAISPILTGADLAVCHLETPVAPDGVTTAGFPRFAVPAAVADGLATAGFDRCSTASNHTLDQGTAGIDATVTALEQRGIAQSGMARTPDEAALRVVDVAGVRVTHLSATWSFNGLRLPADQPWRSPLIDPDRLVAEATAARAAGADVVVVSLHWGTEYSSAPSGFQREVAQVLAGSGQIDLIVGHHAHVLQPVEQVADRWVLFGLGNLLSNQSAATGLPAATQDGVLARVRFVERPEGGFSAERPELVPTWVDRRNGFVVLPVTAALADPAYGGRHGELRASLDRTMAVVGDFVVPG